MLVDTSVWIDHFREADMDLESLLDEGRVATHPFVIGELACGSLHHRAEILRLLETLPSVPVATHDEVLALVDRHHLHGAGLGWIDMHLLASAKLGRQSLWSADRRLHNAARRLRLNDFD
jgi:predicted nucleic acid-binding protein